MAYMEEDWGLQAVVRGCSTHDQYTADYDLYDYNIYHDDLFYNFPNIQGVLMNNNNNVNSSVIMNQVDDLYNPIYDSNVTSFSPQLDHSESQGNDEVKSAEQVEDVKVETVVVASPKATTPAAKYKRKNQQKRVVHATAEGLSSDLWAWRKYGQKPIKGSPHPRSYYRCSSSKGCLARKQVEESCSKPGMFILTYTAEHNHSQPTRRSSLAGTNRQKSSALKRTSSGESCLSSTTTTTTTTTTKESSISIKHEMNDINYMTIDNEQSMVQDNISGDDLDFVIPDSILTDDFFVGLNDLDGLASNSSFYM